MCGAAQNSNFPPEVYNPGRYTALVQGEFLQLVNLLLLHYLDVPPGQGGSGGGGVRHPEDHIGVVRVLTAQEGVHVLHVHLGVGQDLQDLVQPAGYVGDGHPQHGGDVVDVARVLQDRGGLIHIVHDDAGDAEIAGLGQREGPHVDPVLGQHPRHGAERAGLILQKDGNLLDAHSFSSKYNNI